MIPLSAESMTERYSDRRPEAGLRDAERRLRERVAELYTSAESTAGASARAFARRALIDAEALCDIAERAIGNASDPAPWGAPRKVKGRPWQAV